MKGSDERKEFVSHLCTFLKQIKVQHDYESKNSFMKILQVSDHIMVVASERPSGSGMDRKILLITLANMRMFG